MCQERRFQCVRAHPGVYTMVVKVHGSKEAPETTWVGAEGAARVCERGKICLCGAHVGKGGCEAGAAHCSRLSGMKRGGLYLFSCRWREYNQSNHQDVW